MASMVSASDLLCIILKYLCRYVGSTVLFNFGKRNNYRTIMKTKVFKCVCMLVVTRSRLKATVFKTLMDFDEI